MGEEPLEARGDEVASVEKCDDYVKVGGHDCCVTIKVQ
jgi:hypothetical protein